MHHITSIQNLVMARDPAMAHKLAQSFLAMIWKPLENNFRHFVEVQLSSGELQGHHWSREIQFGHTGESRRKTSLLPKAAQIGARKDLLNP